MHASSIPHPPPVTLRLLLEALVDYAGLFPPAALTMREAVENYATYLRGADAWALGRFVVPVTRLEELALEALRVRDSRRSPWRVSALASGDVGNDLPCLLAFNAAHRGALTVDALELRAASEGEIDDAARATASTEALAIYVELPVNQEPRRQLAALERNGLRAKARCGGTTADAIPDADDLARFIARCVELAVPFKATAGLHHPLRGAYPLTYEPESPTATMFGFLNVFLASAFAYDGMDEATLVRLLDEHDASTIEMTDDAVRWRGRQLPVARLAEARRTRAIAFGSCSFREPIDGLRELALL